MSVKIQYIVKKKERIKLFIIIIIIIKFYL